MSPIKAILVPTDFGEAAETARRFATDLASTFKSDLHLLHVVPVPFINDPWETETLALSVAAIVAESERAAHQRLAGFVPARPSAGRRTHIATARGPAVEGILSYVTRHHVDLIVMGTHGRGVAAHLVLGSVAERIVRLSPVPVLTLHGDRGAPRAARRRPARRSRA
jgi:nucleotide-binding universal stress UspA family protein